MSETIATEFIEIIVVSHQIWERFCATPYTNTESIPLLWLKKIHLFLFTYFKPSLFVCLFSVFSGWTTAVK